MLSCWAVAAPKTAESASLWSKTGEAVQPKAREHGGRSPSTMGPVLGPPRERAGGKGAPKCISSFRKVLQHRFVLALIRLIQDLLGSLATSETSSRGHLTRDPTSLTRFRSLDKNTHIVRSLLAPPSTQNSRHNVRPCHWFDTGALQEAGQRPGRHRISVQCIYALQCIGGEEGIGTTAKGAGAFVPEGKIYITRESSTVKRKLTLPPRWASAGVCLRAR